jgi:hypothetical protein
LVEATSPPGGDVFAEAIDLLACFTVPLYIDERSRPLHIGTGFFVNVGPDCFLVSAAHVFDIAAISGMYFYSTENQKRHLDGNMLRSKAAFGRKQDKVDIGVLRLGTEGRPPFSQIRKFAMDISYLKPEYIPRAGKGYVIIGFPCTKNGFRVHTSDVLAAPYAYRSDSIPDEDYAKHGVSTESHVVLPLNLKKVFGPEGQAIHFPKPEGMSGAPVVVLYGDSIEQSRVFPVAAVGIEYRAKEKVLIATDVRFVIDAIRQAA